jgi:hypothetical protein
VALTSSKIAAAPSTALAQILVRALKRYQENSATRSKPEHQPIRDSDEAWYFSNALLTYKHTNEP